MIREEWSSPGAESSAFFPVVEVSSTFGSGGMSRRLDFVFLLPGFVVHISRVWGLGHDFPPRGMFLGLEQ